MIDLRSDTVTQPSNSMRKAMANTITGDDVLREDPTILELEEKAAALTGKEASLFTPSGTFANQLSLFTWCPEGGEVYLSENTHIIQHEAGASARISGVFTRPFPPNNGHWTQWDDIEPRIRIGRDQHHPVSALICLENALSDGTVQPTDSMALIKIQAEKLNIPVHLDGARLFNAAVSLQIDASVIAHQVDSVMFCLSKGLGAPVGSLLCGPRDFIKEAFYKRKIMGGGMRQAGVLAAAGLVALDEELPRLEQDHHAATALADGFKKYNDTFHVLTPVPDINMVFLRLVQSNANREKMFLKQLYDAGIQTYPPSGGVFRFVVHRDVKPEDVEHVLYSLPRIAEGLQ